MGRHEGVQGRRCDQRAAKGLEQFAMLRLNWPECTCTHQDWENLKKVALDWEDKESEAFEAKNYYGIDLFHLGEIELAEKQFKQVIQLNEKHSQSIYYLYKIAKINNQPDVAESYKTALNNLDDSILANEK